MKKLLKSVLILFSILLVIFLVFIVTQYDNLKALMLSMNMSDEDISVKIEENHRLLQEYMNKYEKYIPTDEIESNDDKLSSLDRENSPTTDSGNSTLENDKKKSQNDTNNENTKRSNVEKQDKNVNSSSEKSEDEIIGKYIANMYSLKNEFTVKLKELEESALKEYSELPENKRNFENKKNLALKYLDYVSNLEKSCDKRVSQNLEELKKELKEINADTSIVKDVMTIYENEKALQKAYYISLIKQ